MRAFLCLSWLALGLTACGAAFFAWAAVAQDRPELWGGSLACGVVGYLLALLIDNVEM